MLHNYYSIKFKCRQDNPVEDIWFNQTSNKVSLMKDIHLFPSLLIDLTELKGEQFCASHASLLWIFRYVQKIKKEQKK